MNKILVTALLLFDLIGLRAVTKDPSQKNTRNYIFFLHNKFFEDHDSASKHQEYGKVEYDKIIKSFRDDGFVVFSEKREANTNGSYYAKKVMKQIDSLRVKGVQSNHITVVGTSKGGYIAQFVSTYAKNPDLNFVFIGSYQESDIEDIPEINFCGNILTIYEKSDPLGVSAKRRKERSQLPIKHFKELELNTGLKHGFLFVPLEEWIKPCKMWAKRNYFLKD